MILLSVLFCFSVTVDTENSFGICEIALIKNRKINKEINNTTNKI